MDKLKLTWPTAAVLITVAAGVVAIAVFAPEHTTEAIVSAIGVALGGVLPALVTRSAE